MTWDDGSMTPADEVTASLPDLRAVRLGDLVLRPAALDQVAQRVLPGTSLTPALGTAFGSSI